MNRRALKTIREMQLNEMTEHIVYARMSKRADGENAKTLKKFPTASSYTRRSGADTPAPRRSRRR